MCLHPACLFALESPKVVKVAAKEFRFTFKDTHCDTAPSISPKHIYYSLTASQMSYLVRSLVGGCKGGAVITVDKLLGVGEEGGRLNLYVMHLMFQEF